MKVKIKEAVGHYGGEPLVVGKVMEVAPDKGERMIQAGVAEKAGK